MYKGKHGESGQEKAPFLTQAHNPHSGFSPQPMLLNHGVGRKKFPLSLSPHVPEKIFMYSVRKLGHLFI